MVIAKPTIMTAVPRFYQNLYTKIKMNFEKQSGIKRKLINQTLSLGKKILKISFISVLISRPLKTNKLIKRSKSAYQREKPQTFQKTVYH